MQEEAINVPVKDFVYYKSKKYCFQNKEDH